MAQNVRPERARNARTVHLRTKVYGAILLSALAFIGMGSAAHSPEPTIKTNLHAAQLPAALSFSGDDVIITGSVSSLFSDETFAGANVDQREMPAFLNPTQEALDVAASFDTARLKIASLREGTKLRRPRVEYSPPISVAAVDPGLMSAALDAIDALKNGKGQPLPASLPQQLAYAREKTPATIFSTPVSGKLSQKSLWCLATAIYFEARGESYRGQVGVAQVVMNRVKHKAYPNTVCGVVFQNQSRRNACQFSFACDGIPERVSDKKSWAQADEIAKKVSNGSLYLTEVANATHYHANYVYPRWAPRLKRMTKIGLHIFYRFKKG